MEYIKANPYKAKWTRELMDEYNAHWRREDMADAFIYLYTDKPPAPPVQETIDIPLVLVEDQPKLLKE